MIDYSQLYDDEWRRKYLRENPQVYELISQENMIGAAKVLSLSEFVQMFIYSYDLEAKQKEWRKVAFQDTLEQIWNINQKSCTLAPREHLKTYSVLGYLIKRVFTRDYPMEINYYHLNGDLAKEKFNIMVRMIERNPILRQNLNFDDARAMQDGMMELNDGTILKALSYQEGVVGKHPHIIVLDDVIDRTVMYSDVQNKKAIDKFLIDIYPQISKEDPDRRIILLGTAQRADDLYHKLPEDIKLTKFQAIINDDTKQVLCPEIYTYEGLMRLKENISGDKGPRFWLKEYMNIPPAALGVIVKPEDIQYYSREQMTDEFKRKLTIVQAWDLSVGKDIEAGDWTAGATLGILPPQNDTGKLKIYILDIFKARIDFSKRIEMIKAKYDEWHPVMLGCEDNAFQYDTVQTAVKKYALPMIGLKSITNKVMSFQAELEPYFGNKQVYLRDDMLDLRDELLALPVGDYDDQADAIKFGIKTYIFSTGGKLDDSEKSPESAKITGNLLEKKF